MLYCRNILHANRLKIRGQRQQTSHEKSKEEKHVVWEVILISK